MVVGEIHHFRKPPYKYLVSGPSSEISLQYLVTKMNISSYASETRSNKIHHPLKERYLHNNLLVGG